MLKAIAGLLGLLVVLGGTAGGYLIGRSSVDRDAIASSARVTARIAGYNDGVRAGVRDGERSARSEFVPGQPAYETIFRAGRRQGYRSGKKVGLAAGEAAGTSVGIAAGQDAVFEGYSGWDVGQWYAIRIGQGDGGAKFSIPTRVNMDSGQEYHLCPDDATRICGGPLN